MKLFLSFVFAAALAFAQIPAAITSSTTVENVVAAINNGHTYLNENKMGIPAASYSSGTTYGKGDAVIDSGITYVSLQNSNTGNTPASSGSYWRALPGGGGGTGALVRDFPAAVCQSAAGSLALSAATATTPTPDCVIGTNGVVYGVAKFADTGTMAVQGHFKMPSSLTSMAVTIEWETTVTNTSLAAVWQLRGGCLANNEAGDLTFNTAQTVTSAALGTARNKIVASISSATLIGCAGSERYYWELYRDPAHASDTLAATAELGSITFVAQ